MKRAAATVIVLAAAFGLGAEPAARRQVPLDGFPRTAVSGDQAGVSGPAAERLAVAAQVIRAREQAQGRGPISAASARYWTDLLARLPIAQLLAIAAQGSSANLREAVATAGAGAAADGVGADLGDSSADLVYTSVTPCRVVDTRVAGGPLAGASQRDFVVAGAAGFAAQGGVACGVPWGATSVAVNVTVTGTAGPGWLRAWPYGSSGTASIINYAGGSTIANGLILPICDPFATTCASDLTVRADAAGTQVVIDVMGYFLQVNKDNFRVRGYSQHAGRALAPIAVGCGSALSAVLEVRQPGVIVARGRVNLELSHASGTPSRVDWGVSMSPASCAFPAGASAWSQLPAALPTGTYSEWGDASLWYFAESAGTYTFYVNGARSQGAGPDYWNDRTLELTFYPY